MPIIQRVLQYTVALQCAALAWWLGTRESPIFDLLWHDPSVGGQGWSEAAARLVEQSIAVPLALAGLLIAIKPARLPVAFLAATQATIVVCMWWAVEGFQPLPAVVPRWVGALFPFLTQAARVGAPVGLLLLLHGREGVGIRVVRWAIAATFFAHGLEALLHNPRFLDMLFSAATKLLSWDMPPAVAQGLLYAIGTADVLVAALCIATIWRPVLWYMAAWGLITAAARFFVYDWDLALQEFLVRLPHATLPLVLALYWSRSVPTND